MYKYILQRLEAYIHSIYKIWFLNWFREVWGVAAYWRYYKVHNMFDKTPFMYYNNYNELRHLKQSQ